MYASFGIEHISGRIESISFLSRNHDNSREIPSEISFRLSDIEPTTIVDNPPVSKANPVSDVELLDARAHIQVPGRREAGGRVIGLGTHSWQLRELLAARSATREPRGTSLTGQ